MRNSTVQGSDNPPGKDDRGEQEAQAMANNGIVINTNSSHLIETSWTRRISLTAPPQIRAIM